MSRKKPSPRTGRTGRTVPQKAYAKLHVDSARKIQAVERERDHLMMWKMLAIPEIDDLTKQRDDLSLFMRDCQLILATGADTLCGTKFIQAGGLQEAFKRYAERTTPKERTT